MTDFVVVALTCGHTRRVLRGLAVLVLGGRLPGLYCPTCGGEVAADLEATP